MEGFLGEAPADEIDDWVDDEIGGWVDGEMDDWFDNESDSVKSGTVDNGPTIDESEDWVDVGRFNEVSKEGSDTRARSALVMVTVGAGFESQAELEIWTSLTHVTAEDTGRGRESRSIDSREPGNKTWAQELSANRVQGL